MFPGRDHRTLRKTRSRRSRLKSRQYSLNSASKSTSRTDTSAGPSFTDRFRKLLVDLQRSGSRSSSQTITQLERICKQVVLKQMSSTASSSCPEDQCPLLCLFCQNLIYEPHTLICGHTFCDQCIKDTEMSSNTDCPRCSPDEQERTLSSIDYARERLTSKNHFLQQMFERPEAFKAKYQTISSYHKGRAECANGHYQQAIDIYSQIIEQHPDDHLAHYGRAKAYAALKQLEPSLADATRVVELKPEWSKGHLCQSEILFEMKHMATALMASLKARIIDPEDPLSKKAMTQHLRAVLTSKDDKETIAAMESELKQDPADPPAAESVVEPHTAEIDVPELSMCKSTEPSQKSTSCICSQFDYKNFRLRDFECSICVNLLWIPITTPCGHVFCRECLIRSVDNTQVQCPMCKTSLEDFFPMVIESRVNKTEIISKLIETYFPAENNERRELYEQDNMQSASIPPLVADETPTAPSIIDEIPVFVCALALPACVCPLHVFEPRYRLMMRRTIETESRTFGMCTYDDHAESFSDYGTLLYIRNLVYTQDGRSVVDTIGQRRFRVLERGMRDGYSTAKVELIHDHAVEQHEFDDLFQLNRDTYNRVRHWFDHLDAYRRTLITRQLEGYPPCDDLIQGSSDGTSWSWIMLNLLPIDTMLQYTALASQSFRIRLQMINNVIDVLLHHQEGHSE